MVTVRVVSTFDQYNFLTVLIQEVTNKFQTMNLLNSQHNQDLIQSLGFDSNQKNIFNLFPFDILVINVPKNFLRKIVGY